MSDAAHEHLHEHLTSRRSVSDVIEGSELLGFAASRIYGATERIWEYGAGVSMGMPPLPRDPGLSFESTFTTASADDAQRIRQVVARGLLYSRSAACVLPLTVGRGLDRETGYFGSRPQRERQEASLQGLRPVLELNAQHAQLVGASRLIFVPRELHFRRSQGGIGAGDEAITMTPRRTWSRQEDGPVPVAHGDAAPSRPPVEVFTTLLLPYFPSLPADDVAKVSSDETDAFTRFGAFLTDRLSALGSVTSLEELTDITASIDDEVATLHREAEGLQSRRRTNRLEIDVFALDLAAAFFRYPAGEIGVLGSTSLLDVLETRSSSHRDPSPPADGAFCVPFLFPMQEEPDALPTLSRG